MERPGKHFRKRDAILACLRETDTHPSAEWIYAQVKPRFPDLSLGTVYRNLTLFKQQGVISSLGTVGGVERFDADTTPHVHFICRSCGAVMDLPHTRIPQQLCRSAAAEAGGQVSACHLTFTGTCGTCCARKP